MASVTPGDRFEIRLRPGYHDAATSLGDPLVYGGRHGKFEVTVSATFDDGRTWVRMGSRTLRRDQRADVTVRVPADALGHIGYRITGSDQDGNALDQWVLRATEVVAVEEE
jgi:hypothetical protein